MIIAHKSFMQRDPSRHNTSGLPGALTTKFCMGCPTTAGDPITEGPISA
eukprot:CAMPEP_0114545214 /NCGR_PEP_ID=MMETSP0114-20121206/3280_1 /TAXON_ID=31324 /ORGANISM="Goniomonas sp, Strain m" /LENGTH=48 /DNA_ID= /DNA_START= /DNA_END= /DNA_ORIENTATION=